MIFQPGRSRGVTVFALICIGQVVSMFGSQLTGFVMGVWVFERTGSATQFSLIAFFNVVPQMLMLPVAGALVDRWDRRWAMILADAGAGAATLFLLAMVASGRLEVWHIYVAVAASSSFTAFQYPAFAASTALLVPKRHLVRANGVAELGGALAMMAAPAAAGFLLQGIGLVGVITIDVVTFLFALASLALVRIPRPTGGERDERPRLRREIVAGWRYIRARHGLLALLVLFAGVNFTFGMVQVALTPLVLSFASAAELGMVLSLATGGMVAGGLAVSLWGGPRRRIPAILALLFAQGTILFLAGLRPSVPLVAAAAAAFMLCEPVILACSQSIWQTKVAPAIQGRVFAIRRVVATSTLPAAFLAVGPLADHVFEPLLAADGALAPSVGRWIGTGPGRGIALMFIGLGAATLVAVAAGALYRPLREVERELPDVLDDEAAAPEPG